MKALRSFFALLLTLSLLLTVASCGYAPVKSSEEELATVLTLDGDLDVALELYRFYFLSELALTETDPATLNTEQKSRFLPSFTKKRSMSSPPSMPF